MMETDQENNTSVEMRATQQRKLCYRDLLSRIGDLQESEDVGIRAINEVGNILKRVNLLNDECDITERVEHADETLLDTIVLSAASSVLVKCVDSVDIFTATYEPIDFCTRLTEAIKDPESEDTEPTYLLKLIEDARNVIPEVPEYSFLFGAYDFTKVPQPKEKKQRSREAQERVEKKELLLVTHEKKEKEGVLDVVNFLVKVLQEEYERNDSQPVKYFEFVVDKGDFGATVENIFYCSFLIRDGKAKLKVDENGDAMLEPMKRKELKQFRKSGGVNTQMISSVTMDDWQRSNVREGLIQRHRSNLHRKK